ncbi:MAG: hypothetical protein AAFR96_01470 [Planctomycetota bacterium]
MTRRDRGFVMPVVMLLSLVVGLVAGVVLSRSAQRSLIVRDQLDAYTASHRERGVREMIAAWLKYSYEQDLIEMTGGSEAGGEAFSVSVGRTWQIRVRLIPAQRTARVDPIGLDAEESAIARSTGALLSERFGPAGLSSRTRPAGPIAIDTRRADDDVVEAVAAAALSDRDLAEAFVREIRRSDAGRDINRADVNRAAADAGIPEDQHEMLQQLFGEPATLWEVQAVLEPTRSALATDPSLGDARQAFEGLIDLPSGLGSSFGAQHPSELFLAWRRINRDEPAGGYTPAAGGFGGAGTAVDAFTEGR